MIMTGSLNGKVHVTEMLQTLVVGDSLNRSATILMYIDIKRVM